LSFSGSIDPLAANGGSFGGRIDNTGGTTVVDPGSEVVIGPSRLTTSQLGNLVNDGGTILLEGLFDNTGNTFTFGGSGTWILGSPTQPDVISGGLVTILPGTVINHGLGLNNLTLGGDLALPAGESISVSEFDGGGHNVSISGSDTAFAVVPGNSGGAATLSNVIVNLGGDATNASGSYLYSSEGNPHADGDLVLDDMTTVQGWGTIGADSDGNQDEYITNEGVISAGVSGKSLVIFPLDSVGQTTFINTGTLQAINGGILNISEADWTNLGTIQALNGGIVTIAGQPGFEISGTGHNGTFAVDSNGQSSISYTGILVPSAFDATLGSNGACGILNITGSLSLGPLASLNLSMAPGAIFTTPYEIISYTGTLGGTFGQVTPGYVVDYSQPGEILVTAVPEPTGCGLLVAGAFAAMAPQPRQFRRR
jgi:hypothetical protein